MCRDFHECLNVFIKVICCLRTLSHFALSSETPNESPVIILGRVRKEDEAKSIPSLQTDFTLVLASTLSFSFLHALSSPSLEWTSFSSFASLRRNKRRLNLGSIGKRKRKEKKKTRAAYSCCLRGFLRGDALYAGVPMLPLLFAVSVVVEASLPEKPSKRNVSASANSVDLQRKTRLDGPTAFWDGWGAPLNNYSLQRSTRSSSVPMICQSWTLAQRLKTQW